MEKSFKYILSYPDSKYMLDEALKRDMAIESLVNDSFAYETKKQANAAVNKLVYDTAEKKGISVYDICFRTIPEWGTPEIDVKDHKDILRQDVNFTQTLKLVPIMFDFEHDGGYWKKKYYALKAKMQEIIDQKEEE